MPDTHRLHPTRAYALVNGKALPAERTKTADPFERGGAGGSFVHKSESYNIGDYSALIQWINAKQGGSEHITRPFAESWAVYACAMARARALISAPFTMWNGPRADADKVEAHPLLEVLRNPFPGMSGRLAWMLASVYLDLEGEVLWLLSAESDGRMAPIGEGQLPQEMLPVAGSRVRADYDPKTGRIIQWRYGPNSSEAEVIFPPESVWHLRLPDPYQPLRGIGPGDAACRAIERQFQVERFDDALLRNMGVPSTVFGSEQMLTEKQAKQAQSQLANRFAGPENHGKPVIIGNGLEPKNVAFSPVDMGHESLREWDLGAIMASFGVTKPILGITDDVNRANAREAFRVFWEVTMLPHLEFIAGEFDDAFLSKRNGPESRFTSSFDTSGVDALSDDLDSKIARVEKLVAMGVEFNKAAELAEWEIDPVTIEKPEPVAVNEGGSDPNSGPEGPSSQRDSASTRRGAAAAKTEPALTYTRKAVRDAAWRRAYQRAFDRQVEPYEKRIAKRSQRTLREFVVAARRRLIEIAKGEFVPQVAAFAPVERAVNDVPPELILAIQALLPPTKDFIDRLDATVIPLIEEAFLDSVAALAQALGQASPSIAPGHARLVSFLAHKRVNLAEGVMSRLAQAVASTIAQVLVESGPLDPAMLTQRIQDTLEELKDEMQILQDRIPERAQRIARTELTSTGNAARFAEMREQGVKRKGWASEPDDAVREEHVELDGKEVGIDEDFVPNLAYPGDPRAEARQVVNCRCSVYPVLDDEDQADLDALGNFSTLEDAA